jgi:hypothetical protein
MIIRPRHRVQFVRWCERAPRNAVCFVRVYTDIRVLDVLLKFRVLRLLRNFDEDLADRWYAWSGLKRLNELGQQMLRNDRCNTTRAP